MGLAFLFMLCSINNCLCISDSIFERINKQTKQIYACRLRQSACCRADRRQTKHVRFFSAVTAVSIAALLARQGYQQWHRNATKLFGSYDSAVNLHRTA